MFRDCTIVMHFITVIAVISVILFYYLALESGQLMVVCKPVITLNMYTMFHDNFSSNFIFSIDIDGQMNS